LEVRENFKGIRVRGRSADADGIHNASQYQLSDSKLCQPMTQATGGSTETSACRRFMDSSASGASIFYICGAETQSTRKRQLFSLWSMWLTAIALSIKIKLALNSAIATAMSALNTNDIFDLR
jgi:hypothetical protein